MSKLPIEYLAGMIDGDGSIYISRSNPSGRSLAPCHGIIIYVVSSDEAAIRQVAAGFGGNVRCQVDSRSDEWRPMWFWRSGDAELMKNLIPHLVLKRRQACLCLQLRKVRRTGSTVVGDKEVQRRELLRWRVKSLNSKLRCPHTGAVSVGYVAGLFDAEGNVGMLRYGNNRTAQRVSATISNNCRCVLEMCAAMFGGNVRRGHGGWRWEIKGHKSATPFLEAIQPFLTIKRERVALALRFNQGVGKNGRYLPSELMAERAEIVSQLRIRNQKGIQLQIPA